MSGEAGSVIGLTFCIAAALVGHRFWKGPIKGSGLLEWYRSPDLPTYMRNLPIVSPVLGAAWVPLTLLFVLLLGGYLDGIHLSHQLQGAVIFFVAGYAFTTGALADVFIYRPPRWLIPPWLREDDERIGFVPPDSDWFEKLLLVAGLPFLLVGLGGFGASLAYLLGVLK